MYVPLPCTNCASTHAGVVSAPTYARRRSVTVRALEDDCSDECFVEPDPQKPKITVEGLASFRERQRQRREGKPLAVWSSSLDRPGYVPEADHVPVPPTTEQAAAADALFETRLRDEAPEGFGEGLEGLDI